MICTLTAKDGVANWCERHKRHHHGHYAQYAVDPGEKGEQFRKFWDGQLRDNNPPKLLRSLPLASQCRHLDPHRLTNDEAAAANLSDTAFKLNTSCRACSQKTILQRCHGGGGVDGYTTLAHCAGRCVDKFELHPAVAAPSVPPRHLLFHLWPRKLSQGTWQRNLDQLKRRWQLFTGKRIIAVATSTDSHDLETVQAYMTGYNCEWIHTENDPNLREVKTFLPLFEQIEGLPGYTFYAQGKGVTKPINPGVSIHAWTAAMYEVLLDYWPLVEEHLGRFPIVGSFRKGIHGFTESPSDWHYSGSFCWFRNSELWRRNWRAIEQYKFGIESYPSIIFTKAEAGCLFFCREHKFNLYNLDYWQQVERELEAWRREKAQYRSGTGSLTTTGQH